MHDEQLIVVEMQKGDQHAFSKLFRKYYRDLVLFAGNFIPEKSVCEDIAQSVFVTIWEKKADIDERLSFRAYLLKAVRNSCMDELRHRKVINEHEKYSAAFGDFAGLSTEQFVLHSELIEQLESTLAKLPEKHREAFELSRVKGMKYKDIAHQLNISERTVEVWMAKTIQLLRLYLKDFLPLLLFLAFFGTLNVVILV